MAEGATAALGEGPMCNPGAVPVDEEAEFRISCAAAAKIEDPRVPTPTLPYGTVLFERGGIVRASYVERKLKLKSSGLEPIRAYI